MKSWVKSKGIETQFEFAGEFKLSEFELSTVIGVPRKRRLIA